MPAMQKGLLQFNKLMTVLLNAILIIVVLALVLSVTWGVLTRSIPVLSDWLSQSYGWQPWSWLPKGQAKWTEEIARFLLIWVTLLGGAAAFGTKAHLGVDYFAEKLHPDARRWMAVFANLVVLFFALAIFVFGGWRVVFDALTMEQMTPALGWKMGHVYLALPIAGFFMVLFTLENIFEAYGGTPSEIDVPREKEFKGDVK